MAQLRQQILILHSTGPDLGSRTIAWALYDGAKKPGELQMQTGDAREEAPPYQSVLDAMRHGWFVMQVPTLPIYQSGFEHELGHLPFEYVLERKVEVHE